MYEACEEFIDNIRKPDDEPRILVDSKYIIEKLRTSFSNIRGVRPLHVI